MWPFSPYPECSPREIDGTTYDYIVVGGHVKDNLISRTPLLSQNFFLGDTLQVQSSRWSEPLTGANGRQNQLWTAEGIGGASRINAMLWTRGMPGDYASWSAKGLTDWAWDKVEPYFRKIENVTTHSHSEERGHDGPVSLRQDKYHFHWTTYLEKAAQNLGLSLFQDSNNPRAPPSGYFPLDTAISPRRERVSAFTAYLNKSIASKRRAHLSVCTGALVTRLQLDSELGVVSGVHVRSSQKSTGGSQADYFVKARREVVICSGAISTPQVLILSGIGPRSACESIGVPVAKELPAVGATLADHYAIPIMLELPKKETLRLLESLWGLWHILLYLFFRTGLMSTSSTTSAIFLQTKSIDKDTMEIRNTGARVPKDENRTEVPDIEIMVIPLNTLERDVPGRSMFSLYPTVVQPRSLGHIELADGDPSSNPRITHPMFLDGQDVAVARLAVRFTMRLAEEFQNSGYPYPAPLAFAPGNRPDLLADWEKSGKGKGASRNTSGTDKASDRGDAAKMVVTRGKTWKTVTDEEIDDYMRRVTHTAFHFSCSCPMSNREQSGVVDQQLRVFGFKNLRIADTSVFPSIPSGHTMAPVIMVAERCADFVKDAWK
ncbi:putative GMC oxidoreductase [Nemania abortiva]|nr:putative GMC oxidoreductase [Nemania abortiva]